MNKLAQAGEAKSTGAVAAAWLRALELTAPIVRNRTRLLSDVVDEQAARLQDAPALISNHETLTYLELSHQMHQYARWALDQGVEQGDVVCLLMSNCPEYLAIWLGVTSAGGTVALLNTHLIGPSLAHCIRAVSPKHVIASKEFLAVLITALPGSEARPTLWSYGADSACFRCIDRTVENYSDAILKENERPPVYVEDRALYIYTSGTTGLPKAASVSHARIMQWSHWFAGMMKLQSTDRLYNCLPLYHSVGGVQSTGASLVAGGSVVIRERFSASQFWEDIVGSECTIFQYIGELCRYLLHAAPTPFESQHRIRLACGNGLAPDAWEAFEQRFKIPQILEFYASTEGGVSLFNVEGKQGAVGRVPAYLAHRYAPTLVRFDSATSEPERDEEGFCIRCLPNEIGEVLGKLANDPANVGSHFEGYVDAAATSKKILNNVFQKQDSWIRTGDLMRKDEKGFYYFVDRVGDTFRWKGENVATLEVSEAICAFPGIAHATVYGVAIPATDGRAGMAAVVADEEFDLREFRKHLSEHLPEYARPRFLRIRSDIEVTGTFKYVKTELLREGYDPGASADALYFDHAGLRAFVPLDAEMHSLIQSGQMRI